MQKQKNLPHTYKSISSDNIWINAETQTSMEMNFWLYSLYLLSPNPSSVEAAFVLSTAHVLKVFENHLNPVILVFIS